MTYLIISPCRNEAEYMRNTLDTVIAQSVLPAKWIIVNDGSTDDTSKILKEYQAKYKWIEIVNRENRGNRSVGPGVIEAFYEGLDKESIDNFDFICKLDLDLRLPEKYFETLINRMNDNPRIGTCSGKPYMVLADGKIVAEKCDSEMSVGASKFYRTDCFKEIGGFVRRVMWDAIDCHRCRMYGWIACSWDDVPDLQFIHLRPMGSSQNGILTGRMRHGYGQYYMGTGIIYITAAAANRILHPPLIIGGLAVMWGYLRSMLLREERIDDKKFIKFIRKYQWQALLKGKQKAVENINNEQKVVWEQRKVTQI